MPLGSGILKCRYGSVLHAMNRKKSLPYATSQDMLGSHWPVTLTSPFEVHSLDWPLFFDRAPSPGFSVEAGSLLWG